MENYFSRMISASEGKIPTFDGPVRNLISFPQYVCKTKNAMFGTRLAQALTQQLNSLKLPIMIKGLLLSSFFLLSAYISAFAQETSVIEVFSENGEKFTLVMNGVVQNEAPATNVKATGLKGDFHKVTVNFEDASLGGVTQNFALQPGMHQRANVVMKRNGKYAVRPFGEPQPIDPAITDAPAPPPPPATDRTDRQVEGAEVITPAGTTTTTTTTTTRSGKGESVRMDVGIGEQRMSIDVEIDDPLTTSSSETTTTVKTTETRSTSMSPQSRVTEEVVKCAPMNAKAFASAKQSVSSKSFADEKKTTVRQVLKSNCMSTDQIIEILGTFNFEDDKLEIAKMAFDRSSDPENYWKINDVFTFSDSIEELDEFLESK
jgi:hypothetical protein